MWFGTKERMTWVKCPAIDASISKNGWSTEGLFLNGGAYTRGSVTGHKRYEFSWNLASQRDIYDILDYADGLYGTDLIYFIDPFASGTNLLPQWWASPRVQAEDAPPLVKNSSVRPTVVDTATNTYSYPTKSAVFSLADNDVIDTLYIPIPEGFELHFGCHGASTGTAEIIITQDGGTPSAVTLLDVDTAELTNTVVSGVPGVTLSARGAGYLTVAGMVAQVLPVGSVAPTGRFISGRGHSGCRFVGTPAVTGYSSALDKIGASAVLLETGAWEND